MAGSPALRVVHVVCSDQFAGVERSVLLSTRAMIERGHRVTVIGGESVAMAEPLAGLGVPWRPATSMLAAAGELWRHGRVDVVHAHMTSAETAAVLSRVRNRGRLVVTRHFGQRRGLTPLGGLAARVINRVPHTEISISRYVQSTIGVPSTIVHHGVENASAVDHLRSKQVVVIQRLETEKATNVAIRAWSRAGLADDGWELVIAGDGSDRAVLQSLADAEGVAGSVRFLGHVRDVQVLRKSAAIQLATPPHEHFGLSVLEAMAVGLPVVASDGGAHPELLGDDYPMLYPPNDVDAAACRLRELAGDAAQRRTLGATLRRRQQERFSLPAHGRALEALYFRALGTLSVVATHDR